MAPTNNARRAHGLRDVMLGGGGSDTLMGGRGGANVLIGEAGGDDTAV